MSQGGGSLLFTECLEGLIPSDLNNNGGSPSHPKYIGNMLQKFSNYAII